MLALRLHSPDNGEPLSAAQLDQVDEPEPGEGWTTVSLRCAALNHHDLFSLRGIGVDPGWLPCILGSDGAGVDEEGNEVIIHPLIADPRAGGGDETLDPRRRMISDGVDGTLSEQVSVPRANLVASPRGCPGRPPPVCPRRG